MQSPKTDNLKNMNRVDDIFELDKSFAHNIIEAFDDFLLLTNKHQADSSLSPQKNSSEILTKILTCFTF